LCGIMDHVVHPLEANQAEHHHNNECGGKSNDQI